MGQNNTNFVSKRYQINSFQAISVIGDARIYFSLAKQRVNFLQKHYQEEISVPTSEKERETFNGSK
jgi:hypothetical protein